MNLANLTGTVSKAAQYLIIVLMVIYTVQSYTVFAQRNRTDREQIFLRQNVSMFVIHFLAYLIMYLTTVPDVYTASVPQSLSACLKEPDQQHVHAVVCGVHHDHQAVL